MSEGVVYDHRHRGYVVQVALDPDEARNVAYALGLDDAGAQQLLKWADEADDENRADGKATR